MKTFVNFCLLSACLSGIIFIQSCKYTPSGIPFPEHETEFAQPVTMPYKLSEPKKIKWESPNPDSIKPITETKLDFNKLPSKPFDIGDFRPFKKPMNGMKFDLNSLPVTTFDLDKLPSQKITFKVSMLGQPIRTKATKPRIRDKAAQSIFAYGLDQGLASGGAITAMFQDSRSFLWIGTSNGLYRFDGENFDLYTAAQGLSDFPYIKSLSEDSQGQIWAYTGGGIDVINLKDGVLKHLGSSQGLTNNDFWGSMEDSIGNIWVGTAEGVKIIDPKNGTMKQLTTAQGLSKNQIFSLLEDDQGNIWIGTDGGGVNIVNQKNNTLKQLTTSEGLSSNTVLNLCKDDKGRMFIGTLGGGLNIVDVKNKTLKWLGIAQGITNSNNNIRSLLPGNPGEIWVGSAKGVDIIAVDRGEIKHLTNAEGVGIGTNSFLKDDQGHVWMSDGYAEVDIIDLDGGMFKKLGTQQGLSVNLIYGLYEDDQGRIWISNGDIIDPNAGTIKHVDSSQGLKLIPTRFLKDEKGQIWIHGGIYDKVGAYIFNQKSGTLKHLGASNGLNGDNVFGIYKDKMDNIWLYCSGGISVYDPWNQTFKNLNASGGLSDDFVWSCTEDDLGNMWVLSIGHGLDIIDPKRETIRHFITGKGERFNSIDQVLVKDEKGKILMSSNGYGLYIIDPVKGTFINFTTKEGLISNMVQSLTEKNGVIYATTNEGLTVITPIGESKEGPRWQVKSYGKPQLIDHVDFNSNSVLLTKKDQFWWGEGGDGIIIMDDQKKDTIIPPAYITGIDIMEQLRPFANKQLFHNNPDTVWSMTMDTFYVNGTMPVDTGYLKTNHISWDSVTGPWNMPVNLHLPYDQNFISFQFTGTHLGNPEKTRYRFILEGIDKSWSNISDRAFTDDYRNLSPGNYTFKVSSRGFNGLWSKPAKLSFTITPPWWQTRWAYSLYAISFTIALILLIRLQTNKIKKENLRLEGKVLQRTKELKHSLEELRETQSLLIQQEKMASLGELTAGIAHEIQNPLNFVNNFSEVNKELLVEMKDEIDKGNLDDVKSIANDVIENSEKINHHGKRAGDIVKGMLQHSRTSSGIKELTDINKLADEYLRLAYHGLRAKDKTFSAEMKTDYDETISKITIVPQDIGRVILNLITNAFYSVTEKKKQQPEDLSAGQAGYEPTIWVSTKKTDGKVLISVKDNGDGISKKVLDKIFQPFFTTKPTGQGTGLGLSLSYDIVKAHGGEIKVETKEGEGSEFIISLPV
jgi:signal transduction histidine kinase/ligand-binding sensor domain-containing protein